MSMESINADLDETELEKLGFKKEKVGFSGWPPLPWANFWTIERTNEDETPFIPIALEKL